MTIKLRILTVILLLNSIVFSQTDTNKICFPYPTAKRIAIDLVKGDSAVAELKHTHTLVAQYKRSIVERDSVINSYRTKTSTYIQEISLRDTTISLQKYMMSELKSDVEKANIQLDIYKTTTKYLSVGLVGTLAVISFLFYLK
jgi:hypothetical protein